MKSIKNYIFTASKVSKKMSCPVSRKTLSLYGPVNISEPGVSIVIFGGMLSLYIPQSILLRMVNMVRSRKKVPPTISWVLVKKSGAYTVEIIDELDTYTTLDLYKCDALPPGTVSIPLL